MSEKTIKVKKVNFENASMSDELKVMLLAKYPDFSAQYLDEMEIAKASEIAHGEAITADYTNASCIINDLIERRECEEYGDEYEDEYDDEYDDEYEDEYDDYEEFPGMSELTDRLQTEKYEVKLFINRDQLEEMDYIIGETNEYLELEIDSIRADDPFYDLSYSTYETLLYVKFENGSEYLIEVDYDVYDRGIFGFNIIYQG